MRKRLPAFDWAAAVLDDLHRFQALVIGPGLGREEYTVAAVRATRRGGPVPTVIDGDGLFALAWNTEGPNALLRRRAAPTVLTPHDGEFGLLTGQRPGADRFAAARRLAADTRAVVLLKGPATVVADPAGDVRVVATGDARLATAGTGDVLAGIIGALLATGMDAVRRGERRHLDPRRRRPGSARRRARRRRPPGAPAGGARAARMTLARRPRWAWAEIDLDALAHNVGVLRRAVAPAAVWAVVKADAYGHGATAVAAAAVAAGCEGLCVALTAEGVALRAAGIEAPILVLSEQPAEHAADDRRPPPDADRHDGGRHRGARRAGARRPRRPPQGRHRDAPRRRRAAPTSARWSR